MRGLPLSTTSSEALAAYERGVDLFLRWRGGALEALNAATSHDPILPWHTAQSHILVGVWATSTWRWTAIEGAMTVANDVRSAREHLHVQAVDAMHRNEPLVADDC